MSPQQRREMIVAAAVPLLVEHGAAVSTHQIAKAAGIGEATVFRAFTDKDELLGACVAAVLRNDQVLAELDDVPLDQPLAARLTEAAATLRAYLDRMGAVIGAVHAAGGRRLERHASPEAFAPPASRRFAPAEHPAAEKPQSARTGVGQTGAGQTGAGQPAAGRAESAEPAGGGREEAVRRTRQAVVRLLEPDREHLRLPVEQVATVFLGMLLPRRGTGAGGDEPSIEVLVDVFLHGAATAAPA